MINEDYKTKVEYYWSCKRKKWIHNIWDPNLKEFRKAKNKLEQLTEEDHPEEYDPNDMEIDDIDEEDNNWYNKIHTGMMF